MLCAGLVFWLAASRLLLAQYEPTAYEQYMLEVTNRARANPSAEVVRLSEMVWGDMGFPAAPDLNEGLAAGTISASAKQPLAFNPRLVQSARNYSNLCLSTNGWGHNVGGTDPGQRMTAAGYVFSGASGWGENIVWSGSTGPYPMTTPVIESEYDDLFIDGDISGRGHRLNLMYPDFKEIGVGIAVGGNYNGGAGGTVFNAVFATMDFAYTAGSSFLTGVVFSDADGNSFYTPGEGIGSVTITAVPLAGGASSTTTTWSSGGYSLRLAPGSYSVSATGSFGSVTMGTATLSSKNVKLDANISLAATAGSVQVTIGPSGALAAGAQWQLDNGPWHNGGDTLGNVAAGSHTIGYSTVAGWTTPSMQAVSVSTRQTTSVTGTYLLSSKAQITSPANGSIFTSSSVAFTWNAGSGISQYALWAGSSPGTYDLYAGLEGSGLSRTLTLPADGRPLYIRLYSMINGAWQYNSYAYTAYAAPVPVKAQMQTPVNGSTLTSSSATCTWSAGTGVSQYALWVGSAPNTYDLYAAVEGTSLTRTLTLPTDGRTLYVSLWSMINGTWQSNSYTYTALDGRSQMTSPAGGSTFSSGNVTLNWSAGIGVSQYALWVGSTPNTYDLVAEFEGTNLSRTLTLPTDGRRLYVRLWSMINGVWTYKGYAYNAFSGTDAKAALTSPVNGSVLTSGNATFNWSVGTGVSQYALWVGSTPNAYDLVAEFEGTNLSRTLPLPADGRPLYVSLWSMTNGVWQANKYVYTAATQGSATKALITSPANGGILNSSTLTLNWNAGGGATQYALWVGSAPNTYDLYAAVEGTNLTQTLQVPLDGRRLYVVLWSWINGVWQPVSYYYDTTQ